MPEPNPLKGIKDLKRQLERMDDPNANFFVCRPEDEARLKKALASYPGEMEVMASEECPEGELIAFRKPEWLRDG